MDCSNPVYDSSRMTIGQMMQEVGLFKRQDLNYLASLAKGAERLHLAEPERRKGGGEQMAAELKTVTQRVQHLVPATKDELDLSFLKKLGGDRATCPISRITFEGVPVHPAGVNQKGGDVSVSKSFGGSRRDPVLITRTLEFLEPSQFQDLMAEKVYTAGTAAGFSKRLREQTTRKCVSILACSGVEGNKKGTWSLMSRQAAQKKLARLFPCEPKADLAADLESQFSEMVTSKISSAGAPYWKKKPEAVPEMLHAVIPLVVEALIGGKLRDLKVQHPELFLVECRNKVDRYEVEKLSDKCRPYFSYPFHWQALFSMISQPFSHGLKKFHEKAGCANAYGFSWAHGGGDKILEFTKDIKDLKKKVGGRPKFYCYGDDADLFFRRDGVLYRVSPDFRQMDGSVDAACVRMAVRYMVDCCMESTRKANPDMLEEELAEYRMFWEQVGLEWESMATNPDFVVDGCQVYEKPQVDGLCTGVVGTTFFDTVKSAFAYDAYCDRVHDYREHHLLEEPEAVKFFKSLGLEIKEGTWNPTPVLEQPSPGQLFNENKFLGVKLAWVEGANRPGLVPYLDMEDWLRLILVPRDDPASFGKKPVSVTGDQRLMFDRARGYILTGAFSNDAAREYCQGLINMVEPVAILMSVQADGGRGEKPEAGHVCGEDFTWPTSDGVPSELWCRNLYLSADNQFPEHEAPWEPVFPGLVEKIMEWRKSRRLLKPRMVVVENAPEDPDVGRKVKAAILTERSVMPPSIRPDPSVMKEWDVFEPVDPADDPELEAEFAAFKAKMDEDYPPYHLPEPKTDKKPKALGKPKEQVKRTARLDATKETKPTEVKGPMPTVKTLLEAAYKTKALTVRDVGQSPYGVMAGVQEDPEEFWRILGLREEWGQSEWENQFYATPVFPVNVLASRLGLTESRVIKEARELGFFVLGARGGQGPLWVFKTPPVASKEHHEPSIVPMLSEASKQAQENTERTKVVTPLTTKLLTHKERSSRGWETAPKRVSHQTPPFMQSKPLLYVEAAREEESAQRHAERIMGVNKIHFRWKTRNVQLGKTQRAETTLLVANAQDEKGERVLPIDAAFVAWMTVQGQSSEANINAMAVAVIDVADRSGLKAPKKTVLNARAKEQKRSPFELAPSRGRVVIFDETGSNPREVLVLRRTIWMAGKDFAVLREAGFVDTGDGVRFQNNPTPLSLKHTETYSGSMKRISKLVREHVPRRFETAWVDCLTGDQDPSKYDKFPEWITVKPQPSNGKRKAEPKAENRGGKSVRFVSPSSAE